MEETKGGGKCFVLLVGLPGAGKSTMARALKDSCQDAEVIEFDQVELELNAGAYSSEKWQASREQSMKRAKESTAKYVILDDNFYYRSMRKPYYQLARDQQLRYLEVHLHVPLDLALQRNSARSPLSRVPDHVIHSMHARLEPSAYPDHSIVPARSLEEVLVKLLSAKVPSPLEPQAQPSEAEQQTFFHALDQSLRKSMTSLLQTYPQLKSEAKAVNEIRTKRLTGLKTNKEDTNRDINLFLNGEIGDREAIDRLLEDFEKEVCVVFKVIQ